MEKLVSWQISMLKFRIRPLKLFQGRIFAIRKRRQTDWRGVSRIPLCGRGWRTYVQYARVAGYGKQVGARSDTFWRKMYGVAKEKRTFLQKSRKLDPSRIFFMASHGVSAHSASWIERLVRTQGVQRDDSLSSKGVVIFRALTFSWISFGQMRFAFGLFAECFRLLSWHVFKKYYMCLHTLWTKW